jgi:hypothetical protein
MRIVTAVQGADWLKARGLTGVQRRELAAHLPYEQAYHVPGDAGRKTALARELAAVTIEREELLIWISGWGIWPSSENQELFYAYRASLGERRSLMEAPCHVLESVDRIVLECLLDLILYFSWDSALVYAGGDAAVSVGHDEILSIPGKDAPACGRFEDVFRGLELRRVS